MTGKNHVKAKNLSLLYTKAKILEQRFEHIQYKHVKREFNKLADSLANKALDKEDTTSCPEYSLRFEENQL
jgi:ribonuclease HI